MCSIQAGDSTDLGPLRVGVSRPHFRPRDANACRCRPVEPCPRDPASRHLTSSSPTSVTALEEPDTTVFAVIAAVLWSGHCECGRTLLPTGTCRRDRSVVGQEHELCEGRSYRLRGHNRTGHRTQPRQPTTPHTRQQAQGWGSPPTPPDDSAQPPEQHASGPSTAPHARCRTCGVSTDPWQTHRPSTRRTAPSPDPTGAADAPDSNSPTAFVPISRRPANETKNNSRQRPSPTSLGCTHSTGTWI